jgi:membrane protease YdiL (CAAX protease family)
MSQVDHLPSKWSITLAALYAVLLLGVAAVLNYLSPYSSAPYERPSWGAFLLWIAAYLPLVALPAVARWTVTGFGFVLSPRMLIGAAVVLTICGLATHSKQPSIQSSLIEAFARSGEEVFFRGFLFLLALKLLERRRRPWLGAILITSMCFVAVHAQTLQAGYFPPDELSHTSHFLAIVQRLLNVFLGGLCFAILRFLTGSVLPGMIAHAAIIAGPLSSLATLLIYGVIIVFAMGKGERVASGFESFSSRS